MKKITISALEVTAAPTTTRKSQEVYMYTEYTSAQRRGSEGQKLRILKLYFFNGANSYPVSDIDVM